MTTPPFSRFGRSLLAGNGAPTNDLGQPGDIYLDLDTGDYYGPKSAGAWGSAILATGLQEKLDAAIAARDAAAEDAGAAADSAAAAGSAKTDAEAARDAVEVAAGAIVSAAEIATNKAGEAAESASEALDAKDAAVAATANKADKATSIAVSGLLTRSAGDGTLGGNQTLTVTESSLAQAQGGTNSATAMTPRRVKDFAESRLPFGHFDSRAAAAAATIPYAITRIITVYGYANRGDAPPHHYIRVAAAPAHPGYFQDAAGEYWELHETYSCPEFFGSAGAADAKSAIDTAIAVGKAKAIPIHLLAASYDTSGDHDLRAHNLVFRGITGPLGTALRCTDHTKSILKIGGRYCDLGNCLLTYATTDSNPPTDSRANALEYYSLRRSRLANILIDKCYRGWYTPPTGGFDDGMRNASYSVTVDNCQILRTHYRPIEMQSYNGGITGWVINNLYLNPQTADGDDTFEIDAFMVLGGWDETVFNQLNLEHATVTGASGIVLGSDCGPITFNSLHVEGYRGGKEGEAIIRTLGSNGAIVNGMTVKLGAFDGTRLGASKAYGLFNPGVDSIIDVRGLKVTGNILSNAAVLSLGVTSAGNTGARLHLTGLDLGSQSDLTVRLAGTPGSFVNHDADGGAHGGPGDANFTLSTTRPEGSVLYSSALTADRDVVLPDPGRFPGHTVNVRRSSSSTGAFNLNVKYNGATLGALSGASRSLVVRSDGANWHIIMVGT